MYFKLYGFCKFGENCSYIHKAERKQNEDNDMDEIMSMKAEIDILKNKIKAIDFMKQDGDVLKKYVADL